LTDPTGADAARQMLATNGPLDFVQQAGLQQPASGGSGLQLAGGPLPVPPGGPVAPRPPGAVAAVGALTGGAGSPFQVQRTSVRFAGPAGMKVTWYAPTPDGKVGFAANFIETPGRYNFLQA